MCGKEKEGEREYIFIFNYYTVYYVIDWKSIENKYTTKLQVISICTGMSKAIKNQSALVVNW